MTLAIFKREKLTDLMEEVLCESSSLRIDKENHVIHGVKILGRESRNGYEYTDPAMDQAANLYEGMDVAIDHDRSDINRERSILESPGVLRSTHRKTDGVYGNFEYLENHPATPVLLERVERGMNIGFSHNARGGFPISRNGKRFVESIKTVKSVDLVLRPATTNNLFESEEDSLTVKEVLESCEDESLASLIEGIASDPMMADSAVASEGELGSDQQLKAAFRSAIVALFEDESLDSKATLTKIKSILKAYDTSKPEVKEMQNQESIATEIEKALAPLVEDVNSLKRKSLEDSVCAEFGIVRANLDKEHADLLESQEDEEGLRKLIESWPPAVRGATKPAAGINNGQPDKKIPRLINARR